MRAGAPFLRAAAAAALLLGCAPAAVAQQGVPPKRPRRQFISFSIDRLHTLPLHFAKWPVEELVGREVSGSPLESTDYRTDDGLTTIDVVEFKRRGRGYGLTVYPTGLSVGPALGLRLSREDLPVIRLAMNGPSDVPSYTLVDAYAIDGAAGVFVSDRSPGWGLGSHAFVAGGAGVIRSSLGDGNRIFAEGGGGLSVGPVGVQLSIKFALNRLDAPVKHKFLTVPIALRTSVSF